MSRTVLGGGGGAVAGKKVDKECLCVQQSSIETMLCVWGGGGGGRAGMEVSEGGEGREGGGAEIEKKKLLSILDMQIRILI